MALIYHIASAADWEQARRDGEYTTSTRGMSLAELRYEPVPGWDDPFPHIYGPLNVDAVGGRG
jgi:uncharacterized protein (DUF952 family)